MTNVLISAAGLCGATIIGAILGFFVKELPHKWNDAVLGYCAGIMLAASTLGLIVPAFEQTSLWWLVVIGVMAGALFLNVLDLVTPHLHHITGLDPEEHRNNARLSHVMLFVMAIALHKLPEGMAAGVSVCSAPPFLIPTSPRARDKSAVAGSATPDSGRADCSGHPARKRRRSLRSAVGAAPAHSAGCRSPRH